MIVFFFFLIYRYREELSGCQDEIQQLRRSLAAAQSECSSVSEERLKLQQEILQLRKEMDDLHKVTMVDHKKAELQVGNFCPFLWTLNIQYVSVSNLFVGLHQVSKIKQEFSLKEKLLEARVQELEEYGRSSSDDLTRLLRAQQKCIQRLKEKSKNTVQSFETNVTKLE